MDSLIDPMDDGAMPLPPFAFGPLCELRSEPYPRGVDDYDLTIEMQAWDLAEINEGVQ